MRVTDVCKQYSAGSTLLMVLLGLLPTVATAQDCNPAKERIYQIVDTNAAQNPDSLQIVLDLTAFVRTCEGDVSQELELWLLLNEVFTLEGLERYEEASERVDYFFANYFDTASDRHRARFLMWRMHFYALAGDVVDMVIAYSEAKRYAHALDVPHRASLILDGAYAYFEVEDYEKALSLIQEAEAVIASTDSIEARHVRARALMFGGESLLHLRRDLPQVERRLDQAARLYGALGDTAKVAVATTLRGLAFAAQGDTTSALTHTARAIELAEESGSLRSQAYTRWRHGKLLWQSGDVWKAEPVLRQALEAAQISREFALESAYELARLYEERREYNEAARYYRTVLDTPQPKSYAAALKAKRKTELAQTRLMLIDSERQRHRDQNIIGILLLSLLVMVALFVLRRQHSPSVVDHGKNGFYIPREMPTGFKLEHLREMFQKIVDSALLARRLAYLYAVLFEPALIRSYIDDPFLLNQVDTDSLRSNAALFRCVAMIETAVDNQVFSRNPANTISNHLRPEFTKLKWPWPSHPLDWKRFFLQYHLKTVFLCL